MIFAAGDMFGGGGQILVAFFYLIFLTDVVGIRPALAGTIILISKIWDAVSDPMMGIITDNTRSRLGRRKPYFLAGFFGISIASFLLWFPIQSSNQVFLFIYVLFSYLFYSSMSTMVMVPYAAMSSEITMDYKERNRVNGSRLIFSQISSLISAVLPLEIVKFMPTERTGYMAIGFFFGLFYAIPYLLIFLKTHERVTHEIGEKVSFSLTELTKPFKIKSFRFLIGIYLFAFLSMDIIATIFAYYMNYFLLRPLELNYVLGSMLITQIALVPIIILLANKIGKAQTLKIAVVFWTIAIIMMAFLSPQWPDWAIYLNAVLMGFGIAGCIVIPWIMFPDITDVGELAFEQRRSGSFSGIMTFMRKFSAAIGIFVVSQIIDIAGYIQPLETNVGEVTSKVLQEQPESLIFALKALVGFPLFLLFAVFLLAIKYPLDYKKHEKLNSYLEWKRGNTKNNPLSLEELQQLKNDLI